LGSAIGEVIADHGLNKRLLRIGIRDVFGISGSATDLLKYYRLDGESIYGRVVEELRGQK
ncbi:MAG TPA: transketolase family protein, partial [Methanothermococcus okinawensis]|nr:transketolase family protein [Methanothermococcus okinawensis]